MSGLIVTFERVVSGDEEGLRLDRWLELPLAGTGLRLRRRLIEDGRVTVNGRPAIKGLKLREGQVVRLSADEDASAESAKAAFPLPEVVAQSKDYAAIAKPAGLHSARLEGRDTPSAEACLTELFPDPNARLLNRLDGPTSGLLMVGFGSTAERRFRRLEGEGEVEKTYQAVVRGCVDEPMELRRALDMVNRKRTKVLAEDDPDNTRWTTVTPVQYFPEQDLTLVSVLIRRGARHQIRAHVADAGFPILGDELYRAGASSEVGEGAGVGVDAEAEGRENRGEGLMAEAVSPSTTPGAGTIEADRLYLHHSRIAFADFEAELEPDWGESFR